MQRSLAGRKLETSRTRAGVRPAQSGPTALGNRTLRRLIQTDSLVTGLSESSNTHPLVSDLVNEVVSGPGQRLDAETRTFMESRLGYDLSQVRLHLDSRAADSAVAVGALAYTVGSDVVFASGKYSPDTLEGRHLLAHELTHVVQQGSSPAAGSSLLDQSLSISEPEDPSEKEAEEVSALVSSSDVKSQASVGGSSAGSLTAGELSVSDPSDTAEIAAEQMVNEVMAGSGAEVSAQSGMPRASLQREEGDDSGEIIDTLKDIFSAGHTGLEIAGEGEGIMGVPGGLAAGLSPLAIASGASDIYSAVTGPSNAVNTMKGVQGAAEVTSGGLSLAGLAGLEAIPGVGEVAGSFAGGMAVGNLIEKYTGIGSKAGDLAFDALGPGPGLWLADHLPDWAQ